MDYKNIDITVDIQGKKISINVDPDAKVSTIKDKINEKENLTSQEYSLKLGGSVLEVTKTIFQSKIHAGSTIKVDYGVINISVKVQSEIKTLEVDPDDKVQIIITKLHEMNVKGEFSLVIGGQIAITTQTIAQAGIKAGSTVVVDYKEITIHYKVLGKTHDIKVDPDNEVSTIKDAIKEKEGIETDKFVLKLQNEKLATTGTIKAAGVKAGSTITVDYDHININVKVPGGNTIKLEVDPDSKVSTIKTKVHEKEITLKLGAFSLKKDGEALDEQKTIYEAGVRNDDTLTADMGSIEITVKLPTANHKKIQVTVDPDNTVQTIKDKIKEKEGIEVEKYDLKIHGSILVSTKTIHEVGLVEGTIIELDYHNFNIELELPTGKTIEISVDPTDKINVL